MDRPDRPPRPWQRFATVIMPVVLSLFIVVAAVGFFVFWSANNSDARALQRQSQLLANFFSMDFDVQADQQQNGALSDDAVEMTGEAYDEDWVDTVLGTDFNEVGGYDQAILLDGTDAPVMMMSAGYIVDTGLFAAQKDAIAPLLAQARDLVRSGAVAAYLAGTSADLPYAGDLVRIGGMPAMVTVMPIASPTEGIAPDAHPYLHVLVDFFDQDYADYVGNSLLVEAPHFSASPSGDPDMGSYPLLGKSGRIIGFFEWRQDRPGRRMLLETAPALAVALLLAGLVIVVLMARLLRYSAALEDGRRQAQHRAHHDALTDLPNRACFEEALDRAQPPFALFMLDLDRFKQVNDTLGHPAGDELIRQVAARLTQGLGPDGLVARLGGDEFAVIGKPMGEEADALALAHRLIDAIGRPFLLAGQEASIGLSIGIALADGAGPAELVRRTDIALYEAKAAGRNCPLLYHEAMDARVRRQSGIEAELRLALRGPGQIGTAFTPVFDTEGKTMLVEAQPRWRHPAHGDMPLAQVLPVAEAAGLAGALGDIVLHAACRFAAGQPGPIVSVPVWRAQMRDPKFFGHLFDVLAQTGLRPDRLELRIDEAMLIDGQFRDALLRFRAAGLSIAVRDFGGNYAALNGLRQSAVGRLCLDCAQGDPNRDDLAIVQAIVNLARAMQVEVTATGLTDPSQQSAFAALGCTGFSGPGLGEADAPRSQVA